MDTERSASGQRSEVWDFSRKKIRPGHPKDQRSRTRRRGGLLLRAVQPVRQDDRDFEPEPRHQRVEASGSFAGVLQGDPGEKNPAAEDDERS